ncbi:MAG: transposase, partial [Lentisphaerae bacterium]|nr:transposase [Lentisphaerota bacterium]
PGAAGKRVADIDVTTLLSSSSLKEGAVAGYNKKKKGRPCFQLSAAFIGGIFVDAKLSPGGANPKDFFQKAVKRLISLGLRIDIVRADSAYMTHENLFFLSKLSPGYAIGAPATFIAVKTGKIFFKKLARLKSSAIIPAGKGVALYDMKEVVLTSGVKTRIVIVRRINRTKKKGKWHVNTYYYGISSNLELSAVKLYRFYHKRQCIEAGFRELKNNYHLERLPFQGLKANEFWVISKIMAMTLIKIFQAEMLPKALQALLRKTLFRRIFQKGLCHDKAGKVQARPRSKYTWHLRRLLCKTERMRLEVIA